MTELHLIQGRKSIRYDHFSDYEFKSCRAVASRLMGVTALKIKWQGKRNKRAVLYQIIHLDYSEYGIDEYSEFECIPGEADQAEKKREMAAMWNHFIAVMGSEVTEVDPDVMMRLISDALPFADEDAERGYDSEENAEFRRFALLRIGYMMDALHSAGYDGSGCPGSRAINAVIPARLSAYETINYFVMRLVDRDFAAASVLSGMGGDDLRSTELSKPGIQTLMRCSIEPGTKKAYPPADKASYPFCCRATTLADDGYHYFTFVIWLSGNAKSKDPVVTDIKVGSAIKLSEYEAAIQLSRPEYITVFGYSGDADESFDISAVPQFKSAEAEAAPNGLLYTAYKPDNSHVDKREYRLEGDVLGHALLSLGGEIILMSHDIMDITAIDEAFAYSVFSPHIDIKGRYRIDNPVFQTICMSPGAVFSDLVE